MIIIQLIVNGMKMSIYAIIFNINGDIQIHVQGPTYLSLGPPIYLYLKASNMRRTRAIIKREREREREERERERERGERERGRESGRERERAGERGERDHCYSVMIR